MSRENKVNPGQYTQAGRLTPDDTAREMKKQREAAPNRTDDHPHPFQAKKSDGAGEDKLDDRRDASPDETEAGEVDEAETDR